MTPERIQLSRAKGWRMPENTVKVDRTTRYGNPFKVGDIRITGSATGPIDQAGAAQAFRDLMALNLRKENTKTTAILSELRGKNLACWCKLGTPCHADVLLELANAPAAIGEQHSQATAGQGMEGGA